MGFSDVAKSIAGVVGTYAPGIATVLAATGVGAPAAAAVSAIGALAKAFGLPDTATHDDVLAAVQAADPEMKLKLISAENYFQLAKRDQDIQILKTNNDLLMSQLKDVQDARGRQTAHESKTGKSDTNLYVLAWVIMGGFFGTILGIIIMKIFAPTINLAGDPLLSLLLGSLSTDAGMVVGYFFGSSLGSQKKDALIYKSTPIEDVTK
jgi:hypothetical protein